MSLVRNINLHDGAGNPIGSLGGAINVHDADVHTRIVNKLAFQETATTTTLTADTATDGSQYTIAIADATGFAINDYIYINTTSSEGTLPRIKASTPALPTTGPATFTLDRRLDTQHLIGDVVTKVITDMSTTTGTMASPQIYSIGPLAGEVWHLTRLLFSITHTTAGDPGLFGNLTALANGVVLRAEINGVFGTFTNWKTSADMKDDMYDVEYDSRSSGGGTFGTSGRGTFKNAGAVIRLDGDTNDKVHIYIQDDITSLLTFTMKFQGHYEG